MISAHFDRPGEIVESQGPCTGMGGSNVDELGTIVKGSGVELFSSCMTRTFMVFGVSKDVQRLAGGAGPEVVKATASTLRTRMLASAFRARLREDSEFSKGGSYSDIKSC